MMASAGSAADRLTHARERLERLRASWHAEPGATANADRASTFETLRLWPLLAAGLQSQAALRWLLPALQLGWPWLEQGWRRHPFRDTAHRLVDMAGAFVVPHVRRHPLVCVSAAALLGALAAVAAARWRGAESALAGLAWHTVRSGLQRARPLTG